MEEQNDNLTDHIMNLRQITNFLSHNQLYSRVQTLILDYFI